MTESRYITLLRKLIAEQQQIQMYYPPSSLVWQNASDELARLGEMLNITLRHTSANVRFANSRTKSR